MVECTYDYMGRRHTRKVSVNGAVSSYLRYMYRGYLQIAAIDAVSGVFRWFLFWDPTQPEATRPLAIRKDGAWYAYGWDLTKNVTEIFGKAGYLRTVYTYTPYGEVTAEGDVTQPIQWSSEYNDEELGLVYYNYRHFNPHDGRWISREPEDESYIFTNNMPVWKNDVLGLYPDIFKGFENDRYQQHDKLIEELVNDFNKHKKEYAGCTEEQANSIPDLDENILKSMMIQETGGGDKRSRAAWNVDPLQVNVPGDFGEEKKCLGLKKPKKRNEGSLKGNLKAGIMYLVRKGFGRSGKAPCDTATFDGWKDAIRRYNGRTDLKNGKKYSEIYVEKIFKRAKNPKIHEKIETN